MTLADQFLPIYDVSDEVATVVAADSAIVWEALLDADLLEVGKPAPLSGLLGALRVLPDIISHLLHGETPARPQSMRLRDLSALAPEQGGWISLGEKLGQEIALGLVGNSWRPVIEFATVTPEERSAISPSPASRRRSTTFA